MSGRSSRGSAGSTSGSNGPVCASCGNARATLTAERCCGSTGPDVPCWESVQALVADADFILEPQKQESDDVERSRQGERSPAARRTEQPAGVGTGGGASRGDPAEGVRVVGGVPRVDIVCGGFPCQPVSLAGRRKAQADERWLWPEFERVVRLLRPRYVLVENVPGLLTAGMGDVLGGLAALGYDAEWDCVPAAAVGAPHIRNRVWIVAYPDPQGELQQGGAVQQERRRPSDSGQPLADTDQLGRPQGLREPTRRDERSRPGDAQRSGQHVQDPDGGTVQPRRIWGRAPQTDSTGWWAAEPDVGRVAHGVPSRLDRLSALGNAVVPQVAEHIGRWILEAEVAAA